VIKLRAKKVMSNLVYILPVTSEELASIEERIPVRLLSLRQSFWSVSPLSTADKQLMKDAVEAYLVIIKFRSERLVEITF